MADNEMSAADIAAVTRPNIYGGYGMPYGGYGDGVGFGGGGLCNRNPRHCKHRKVLRYFEDKRGNSQGLSCRQIITERVGHLDQAAIVHRS